jgi:hypothetical protein
LAAALFGLAMWKNGKSYSKESLRWRITKSAIDTLLVILMLIYTPALLVMYTVFWLAGPFKSKIIQGTAAFMAALALSHIAGVALEIVAALGIFAIDLVTGQVVARMRRYRQVREKYTQLAA